MRHMSIAGIAGLGILVTTAGGQRLEPKTHRLEATPSTVTYMRAIWIIKSSLRDRRCSFRCSFREHCLKLATGMPRKVMVKSIRPQLKRRFAAAFSSPCVKA